MGPSLDRLLRLLPDLWPALCRHSSAQDVSSFWDYSHDLEHEPDMSLYDLWLSSRLSSENVSQPHLSAEPKPSRGHLPPGSQRPLTLANLLLAWKIVQASSFDVVALLWSLNPLRTLLFVFLTLVRGLLPAFRGYSQAMILDEVCSPLWIS